MATSALREHGTVPRGAIVGAAALVAFTIVAAMAGRISGIGTVKLTAGQEAVISDLRFEDGPEGEVIVRRAADGQVVDTIAPKTGHFVRGTLRALVRTRKKEHIGSEPPFRLARLSDGRLRLEDPATQRRIDLNAFGPSNVGAFSAIMDAAVRFK